MVTPAGYALFSTILFLTVPIAASGTSAASPGRVVVISLYKRGYAGASVELSGAETPLTLEVGDDDLSGVKSTKATITFIAQAGREISDFYGDDDRQFFVAVLGEDDTPADSDFYGWLSPFSARAHYAEYGAVEMSATDGLGSLTDFTFRQYPSGLVFPGTHLLHGFMNFALQWAGYQLPIWYNDHLVEEQDWLPPTGAQVVPQHPGPALCPWNRMQIEAALWYDGDAGNYLPCKTVLDDLAEARYLRIQQHQGIWKISHLPDLPGRPDFSGATTGTLRYWNAYAAGAALTSLVTENPEKTIYTDAAGLPIRGSETGVEGAKRRYVETYSYGNLPNQANNGGFIGTPGTVPDKWTLTHVVGPDAGSHNSGITDAGNGVIVGDGTETMPYFVRILGLKNGDPKRTLQTDYRSIYIVEQPYYISLVPGQQRKITVSGIYKNHLTGGAAIEVVATLGYYDNTGAFNPMPEQGPTADAIGNSFNLQADGSWGSKKKSATVLYLHFLNLLPDPGTGGQNDHGKTYQIPKDTNGETFSLTSAAIPNLPYLGASVPGLGNNAFPTVCRVVINLWPGPDFDSRGSHAGCYTDYRNIGLVEEEAALIDLDKELITVQVAGLDIRARLVTQPLTLKLGDQTTALAVPPRTLRPGGYRRFDGLTPTRRWMTFYGGHVDKIQNQIPRARLIQTQIHRTVFDGTLLGDIGPLDVLVFTDLADQKAIFATWKLNVRLRQIEGRTVAIATGTDELLSPDVTGRYQTKDGADAGVISAPVAGPGTVTVPILPGTPFGGFGRNTSPLTAGGQSLPLILGAFTALDVVAVPAPGESRIDGFFDTL